MLEDMLRAYILDFGGSRDQHLPLYEFAYNNNYHSSISMTPFEVLYGRPCRSLTYYNEVGNRHLPVLNYIQEIIKKVNVIQNTLSLLRVIRKVMVITKKDFWSFLLVAMFFLRSFHTKERCGLKRGKS